MLLTLSLRDGSLGYSASAARGLAVLGPATSGTVNQLVSLADPQQAYDSFVSGKLADRCAFGLIHGPGPIYAMRCATSTAGSMPSYRKQASDTLAGNNAGNAFAGLVQPAAPRNIEVDFAAGWDGGNVTIVGTGADGGAITEVITAAANSTVKGKRVFKTITSASKGAVGAAAATAQLFSGNKSAEGSSSTDGQIASTGSAPLDDFDIWVRMTRDGNVAGPSSPAFTYSLDGGDTWSAEIAVPVGGSYTGLATSHGLTLVFTGSAMKAGDAFRFASVGPSSTTGDLQAGLDALAADSRTWEGLHIMGPLTAAQAAVVETWVAAQRAVGRYLWVVGEARDIASTETEDTWMTALLADYAGFTSTYGQVSIVAGYGETVLPGARGIQRRSLAWSVTTQIARMDLSQHPGQPQDAGPLRGIYKPANIPGVYHDERAKPGLGGTTGRFTTVQTILGDATHYYVGDAGGKRSPGTMAAATSDYSMLMNVRVIMEACRLALEAGQKWLARQLATKTTGELLPSQADKVDKDISTYLETYLVGAGHAVSAYAVVSRSEKVLATKKLPIRFFVRPYGYALEVAFEGGFESVIV